MHEGYFHRWFYLSSYLCYITIFSPISQKDLEGDSKQLTLKQMKKQLNDIEMTQQYASMYIPAATFTSDGSVSDKTYIHSFLFNNSKLFQTSQSNESSVHSKILSVTVGKQKIYQLPQNITLRFKRNNRTSSEKEFCGFWDENKGWYSKQLMFKL